MATQPTLPPPPQPLFEEAGSLVGGQDASKFPALVDPNQYFAGVNVNVANGFPVPRWGWNKKKIVSFPAGGIKQPNTLAIVPYEEIFYGGRFQAFIPYNIGPDYYLIVVVSGIIFLINQVTWVATILPIQGGGNLNENTPRLNWASANKYLVIWDYPNLPVVFDGVTVRRSSAFTDGIPTSVGGIYNQNRLFIYNAGNSYTAGDPTGSLAAPQAPVTFVEIEDPGSPVFGEVFDLPTDRIETITAMANLQLVDTSTGIGPLLIGTKNAIYSVQSNSPRVIVDPVGNQVPGWEVAGFASAFVLNAGIAGPRALVNVNSDVFFMSPDGHIRTSNMSRAEQSKWARTPVSKEVQNWIGFPDETLTPYATAAYFRNKIFFTVNPYRTNALDTQRQPIFDVAHGGLIVLSLDNLAVLGKDSTPAWDGLWTGIRPMGVGVNNNRLFFISKDAEFRNEIYELDPETTYDRDGDDIRYVNSTVYTKEYTFNSVFQDKDIHSVDLDLRTVGGDLDVLVSYKPNQSSRFVRWREFTKCAPWRFCKTPTPEEINGLAYQNYFALNLGSPEEGEVCAEPSGVMNSVFRTLQLKIDIQAAYWRLQGYRIHALVRSQPNTIYGMCDDPTCKIVSKECNPDWSYGAFKSCLTVL